MRARFPRLLLALFTAVICSAGHGAVIKPGTPITSNDDLPAYLTDGSYLFGMTVSLGTDQFLLPIEIADAPTLRNFQFDLAFDQTVVNEVDPGDGSSGIYGARFSPSDSDSLSFILAGFPINSSGRVESVAGEYPSLLTGPSGTGTLAYVLFEVLTGQQGKDPGFSVTLSSAVPEPASLPLMTFALFLCGLCMRPDESKRRRVRGTLASD